MRQSPFKASNMFDMLDSRHHVTQTLLQQPALRHEPFALEIRLFQRSIDLVHLLVVLASRHHLAQALLQLPAQRCQSLSIMLHFSKSPLQAIDLRHVVRQHVAHLLLQLLAFRRKVCFLSV